MKGGSLTREGAVNRGPMKGDSMKEGSMKGCHKGR